MLKYIGSRLKWIEASGKQGVFSEIVLKTWFNYRQKTNDANEAGGLLVGRVADDTNALLVDLLTTPSDTDEQSRYGFYRSESHNQDLLDYWHDTDGYGGLLGLWHTHPENKPTPSDADIEDLVNTIESSSFVADRLVYVIVGITHIGVWVAEKSLDIEFVGYVCFNTAES